MTGINSISVVNYYHYQRSVIIYAELCFIFIWEVYYHLIQFILITCPLKAIQTFLINGTIKIVA